jgi:hypothetical protein
MRILPSEARKKESTDFADYAEEEKLGMMYSKIGFHFSA